MFDPEFIVLSPPLKVTAPAYCWLPEEVTFAPRLDVPVTLKVVRPVATPSKSKPPVTVRALEPPVTVLRFIVPPCKFTPVLKVVVPE